MWNIEQQQWIFKMRTDSFFIDLFFGQHQKKPSNCVFPFFAMALSACVYADGKSLPIDVDTNEADSNVSSVSILKALEANKRQDVSLTPTLAP